MPAARRAGALVLLLVTAGLPVACGGDARGAPPPTTSVAAPAASTGPAPRPSGGGLVAGPAPTSGSPTASPAPPAGTAIAGESLTDVQAAELQRQVDEGHQPWRTDAAAVADAFVRGRLGWDDAAVTLVDPHTAEVTRPADGRRVRLELCQPVREGPGGIWVVVGGVWLN